MEFLKVIKLNEKIKNLICVDNLKMTKIMDIIYITIHEVMMTRNMNFKMMFR
jgi:hypothetical protein